MSAACLDQPVTLLPYQAVLARYPHLQPKDALDAYEAEFVEVEADGGEGPQRVVATHCLTVISSFCPCCVYSYSDAVRLLCACLTLVLITTTYLLRLQGAGVCWCDSIHTPGMLHWEATQSVGKVEQPFSCLVLGCAGARRNGFFWRFAFVSDD